MSQLIQYKKNKGRRQAPQRNMPIKGQVALLVREAMLSKVEVKRKSVTSFTYCPGYGGGTLAQVQLTPNSGYLTIAQGSGQGDRVGNRIHVKRASLRIVAVTNPYDVVYSPTMVPYDVRIIIASNKQNPVATILPVANMFQDGDTSDPPTGALNDMLTPVNLDLIKPFMDRRFKLGVASATGTGGYAAGQYWSNNDYKYNVLEDIDITSFVPKEIEWNDTTTTPISRSVYMLVLPAAANGAISTDARPLSVYWAITYEYTDL